MLVQMELARIIISEINDMETHVNAVLAWHLKKLTVGVVPG